MEKPKSKPQPTTPASTRQLNTVKIHAPNEKIDRGLKTIRPLKFYDEMPHERAVRKLSLE